MAKTIIALALPLLMILPACGGGDETSTEPAGDTATDDSEADDTATEDSETGGVDASDDVEGDGAPATTEGLVDAELPALPDECTTANELQVTLSEFPELPGPFPIVGSVGVAVPIVPNGDGSLDDLGMEEFNELGAESKLLAYTQWVGNHPFSRSDLGIVSGPTPPEGALSLALSVVPTSLDGLADGQTISDTDEFEFDAISTFSPAGVFVQGPDDWETWFLVNRGDPEQGGTAEVLFVDDEWLCVDWQLSGETRDPEGTYEISGIVLTQYERRTLPFT